TPTRGCAQHIRTQSVSMKCMGKGQWKCRWISFCQLKKQKFINHIHTDISTLNDIGVDMMREFERTGDLVTVNEAMAVLYRVVQLTPEGHADLPGLPQQPRKLVPVSL
ncbi:hypothetical protein BKA70DRAFT_1341988, partial [Coprinopsis sp. MPI-PUGE-AT-0042]